MLQLFLTHLQGYKRDAIKAPILIVLEVLCELLLPLVMSEIVDVAIPQGDVTYIFQLGGLMLLLALIAMACGVYASKYAARAVGLRVIAILPVMMLALNGATVAVLYFGGRMVMGGAFDLGSLQAFINYIVQILMSVMMVAMSLLQLSFY